MPPIAEPLKTPTSTQGAANQPDLSVPGNLPANASPAGPPASEPEPLLGALLFPETHKARQAQRDEALQGLITSGAVDDGGTPEGQPEGEGAAPGPDLEVRTIGGKSYTLSPTPDLAKGQITPEEYGKRLVQSKADKQMSIMQRKLDKYEKDAQAPAAIAAPAGMDDPNMKALLDGLTASTGSDDAEKALRAVMAQNAVILKAHEDRNTQLSAALEKANKEAVPQFSEHVAKQDAEAHVDAHFAATPSLVQDYKLDPGAVKQVVHELDAHLVDSGFPAEQVAGNDMLRQLVLFFALGQESKRVKPAAPAEALGPEDGRPSPPGSAGRPTAASGSRRSRHPLDDPHRRETTSANTKAREMFIG